MQLRLPKNKKPQKKDDNSDTYMRACAQNRVHKTMKKKYQRKVIKLINSK